MKDKGMEEEKKAYLLGFCGIEIPDVILYLSRILYKLGKRVLICDYSPEGELEYYIPFHNEINPLTECVDYRGVDYTRQFLEEEWKKKYDFLILNFGFGTVQVSTVCHRMIYVSDWDKAHIKRLEKIPADRKNSQEKMILIRDMIPGGIRMNGYFQELKKLLQTEELTRLKLKLPDLRAKMTAEYNDVFVFRFISRDLYNVLLKEIQKLCPNEEEKKLFAAIRSAEKGE